jgi:hypothetical protein
MITVGVCDKSNGEKSDLDNYLRDILVSDIHVARNPAVKQLRGEQVSRSVRSNRSTLSRQAVADGRLEPIFTPGGLYAGECVSVSVDPAPFVTSLRFIVRGLYFYATKERIPDDYVYAVARLQPQLAMPAWANFGKKIGATVISMGKHVFDAKFNLLASDRFTSNWCLLFYERLGFFVFVTSRDNASTHLIPRQAALRSGRSPGPIIINPIPDNQLRACPDDGGGKQAADAPDMIA